MTRIGYKIPCQGAGGPDLYCWVWTKTLYGSGSGVTGACFMVVLSNEALMEDFMSMELERAARPSERDGIILLKEEVTLSEELVTTSCERVCTSELLELSRPPLRPTAVAHAPRTSRKSVDDLGWKLPGAIVFPKLGGVPSQSEFSVRVPTFWVCFVEQF